MNGIWRGEGTSCGLINLPLSKEGVSSPPSYLPFVQKKNCGVLNPRLSKKGGAPPLFFAICCKKSCCNHILAKREGKLPSLFFVICCKRVLWHGAFTSLHTSPSFCNSVQEKLRRDASTPSQRWEEPIFCNSVQDSSASFLQLGTIKFQCDASKSLQREGELFPLFFAIRCKKSDASTSLQKRVDSSPSFLQLGAKKTLQREGETLPPLFCN